MQQPFMLQINYAIEEDSPCQSLQFIHIRKKISISALADHDRKKISVSALADHDRKKISESTSANHDKNRDSLL